MNTALRNNCPRCGAPIQVGQTECSRCGLLLNWATPAARAIAAFSQAGVSAAAPPLPEMPPVLPATQNRLLPTGLALLAALVLAIALTLIERNGTGSGGVQPGQDTQSPTATQPVVAVETFATAYATPTAFAVSTVAPTAIVPLATDTPLFTQAPATGTATEQPLFTAAPPTDTPIPPATDTAVPSTAVPSTPTPEPPLPTDTPTPSPTPLPTATPAPPVPPVVGTTKSLAGWQMQIAGIDTAEQVVNPGAQQIYRPSQGEVFRLIRVDATNNSGAARSLGATTDFVLKDDLGRLYTELSDHGKAQGWREIAGIQGFSSLDAAVPPGGRTSTLLVFSMPADVQPAQLVGRIIVGKGVSPDGQVVWNLGER